MHGAAGIGIWELLRDLGRSRGSRELYHAIALRTDFKEALVNRAICAPDSA